MERKELVPYDESGGMSASYGEVQPSSFVTRITFNWQLKCFAIGKAEDGRIEREITFEPIFRYSGIKRNFENDYGTENARPTCYSLDGKNGSVPQISRLLADGREHIVYGECRNCRFGTWSSRNLWKPPGSGWDPKANKAKNCGTYTLILSKFQNEVMMIQVPSTGVESVNQGIESLATAKGKRFEECRWQLLGTGGGFQSKYMKIIPVGFLTSEEQEELHNLRMMYKQSFEDSVYTFAQGGVEDETVNTNGGQVVDA